MHEKEHAPHTPRACDTSLKLACHSSHTTIPFTTVTSVQDDATTITPLLRCQRRCIDVAKCVYFSLIPVGAALVPQRSQRHSLFLFVLSSHAMFISTNATRWACPATMMPPWRDLTPSPRPFSGSLHSAVRCRR